jgi:hypothetical protein
VDTQERELREDRIGRSVRAALSAERAPRAWARDALAVTARVGAPARTASAAMPREESRLLVVLPHILGVALLLGLGLSALLRPGLLAALDGLMKPLFAGGSPSAKDIDVARLVPWLAVTAPLIVLVLLEATRGFAFVRRWFS